MKVRRSIFEVRVIKQIAKDNPDLPASFIKDVLAAKAEIDAGDITPFIFQG